MCKRKAKPLTAKRDRQVYINAEDVVMFCSIRCAANYGLLWGVLSIEQAEHFCQVTKEWEVIGQSNCRHCGGDE
jgi:hypothetical protein